MADTPDNTPAAAEEAEEEGRTRLPRVVVRMSDAMKAALDAYCKDHELVATSLGRELLATRIGFDLSKDPDAPGAGTRTKYADDNERDAAKLRNRAKASMLRKALSNVHLAQIKKRPLLLAACIEAVTKLSDDKITKADIDALEVALDAAIKEGK